MNYEVKSAVIGGSFEYQYHRNHGLEKLTNDSTIDHIFIVRNESYSHIEVWLIGRSQMISTFDKWLPELLENYETLERQRFRRSVTFGFVRTHGIRLLEISDGTLKDFLESV